MRARITVWQRAHIYAHVRKSVVIYCCWQPEIEEAVACAAVETLRKHYLALLSTTHNWTVIQSLTKKLQEIYVYNRIAGVLKYLKGLEPIQTSAHEWDADPWLLNVANGTLDLRTGTLRPHDPADLITKLAPVEYDPDAKGELWERHVRRFLPNPDIRRQVQRDLGRALPGVVLEESMQIWFGAGANGKTTTAKVLQGLLVDYVGYVVTELFVRSKGKSYPAEIADLCRKRLLFSEGVGQVKKLVVALVKKLTGGHEIQVRFKKRGIFSSKPAFSIFLICDRKPIIAKEAEDIRRRIRLIPWEYSIPEEEVHPRYKVVEDLLSEGPVILNWLLDGLADWLQAPNWIAQDVRAISGT